MTEPSHSVDAASAQRERAPSERAVEPTVANRAALAGAVTDDGQGVGGTRRLLGYAFWVLWSVIAIAAVIFVAFFFAGIGDGSISSANLAMWLLMLMGPGAVLGGSFVLYRGGEYVPAMAIVLMVAVPTLIYALYFLVLIGTSQRWN